MTLLTFKKLMLIWAWVFLGAGLFMVALPTTVIQLLNECAHFFGTSDYLAPSDNHLWLSLAGSLMMTIAFLSYRASKEGLGVAVQAVWVSKVMSTLFFIVSMFRLDNTVYALAAGVDAVVFLSIWLSAKKVVT